MDKYVVTTKRPQVQNVQTAGLLNISHICLFVCTSAFITRPILHDMLLVYQQLLRCIGHATARVVLCCLDDEQVEDSYDKHPVFTH